MVLTDKEAAFSDLVNLCFDIFCARTGSKINSISWPISKTKDMELFADPKLCEKDILDYLMLESHILAPFVIDWANYPPLLYFTGETVYQL